MGDHAPGAAGEAGDLSAEALEAGRLLFAAECRFLRGAARSADLPPPESPEIAFAGRSNVGKSSLVNALTGRSTLARVAKAPGRTQQLNFFALGPDRAGRRLTLVDMPGYGYAKVAKEAARLWSAVARDYLRGRAALRRALVLVDSRHGLKPADDAMLDLLDESAVSYQAVLTKSDQLAPAQAARARAAVAAALSARPAAHPEVLVTSATTGAGVPELRAALAALAAIG
jgi:GTP-binding protein